MARQLGAAVPLNPVKVDVVQEVMRLTEGPGVNVVAEAVGHPPALKPAGDVIKSNRSKMLIVGWHQQTDTYDLSAWIKSPIIYSS